MTSHPPAWARCAFPPLLASRRVPRPASRGSGRLDGDGRRRMRRGTLKNSRCHPMNNSSDSISRYPRRPRLALPAAVPGNGGMEHVNDAPTILVVDDTVTNLILVSSVLEAEGFRTLTACDGPTARDLSRSHQPDLILLDVLMPGETGFETCAQLKSDPLTADIPIIFLSSLDDVKSKVAGLKIGGVDYIAKPVHGEEVLARVRVHLRIRETNRALVQQQRARLDQLRDAQTSHPGTARTIVRRPVSRSTTSRSRRREAISTTLSRWGRYLRLLCGGYQRSWGQCGVSYLGREGTAAPVRRPDVLAGGHHARRGFGDGPDAGRGAVFDGLLRPAEPADRPAHRD